MTEKHPKRPRDANLLAMSIVQQATESKDAEPKKVSPQIEAGRIGGL